MGRLSRNCCQPFANPCKDEENSPSVRFAFRHCGRRWWWSLAGGYVDTQRNGSLMEKEAEGEVPRKGKERKEGSEGEREGQSTYIRRGENVSRDRMKEGGREATLKPLSHMRPPHNNIPSLTAPPRTFISPRRMGLFVRSFYSWRPQWRWRRLLKPLPSSSQRVRLPFFGPLFNS